MDLSEIRTWAAKRLLAWFRRCCRDLPWRANRDPYRIWVSEVMLQQTQVATVVPYFERFLQRFPTVSHLAAAPEQEVLRLWEGLGYYRRARDLHRAAQIVQASHQGEFPRDPEKCRWLPGLGEYTRNAVLSQAFDLRLPILEANSARVLSRLLGQREDPRRGPVRKALWKAAESLLPEREVGDFNQALMELGALLCTPTRPQCDVCPLGKHCRARASGRPEDFPQRDAPPEPIFMDTVAVILRRGEEVLLLQRPSSGRWANLWEFPSLAREEGEPVEKGARRVVRHLTGMTARIGPKLAEIKHGVTRYRITMICHQAEAGKGEPELTEHACHVWVRPTLLETYPLSSPHRRLAQILTSPAR